MRTPAEPCNCIAIRQAGRHVARRYERAFAPLGLTIDQYATLAKLDRLGPSSIADLAERLFMDRAMLTYVLKTLVDRRLVVIAPASRDRRRRTVTMTETGSALFAEAKQRWLAINAQVDAALGERALLLRQLLKEVEAVDLRLDDVADRPTFATTPDHPITNDGRRRLSA